MVNEGQSRATGALFFLKTGCLNEVLVVSGNRATANFEHWCSVHLKLGTWFVIFFFQSESLIFHYDGLIINCKENCVTVSWIKQFSLFSFFMPFVWPEWSNMVSVYGIKVFLESLLFRIFSIIVPVIIEMHALWLVINYVISCYNHPRWGNYKSTAALLKF